MKYIARVYIAGYRPGQEVPEALGKANKGRFARDGDLIIPVVEKVGESDPKPETEEGKAKRGRARKKGGAK